MWVLAFHLVWNKVLFFCFLPGASEESESILLPSAHGSAGITEFSISVDSGGCISSFLAASAYTH